jgi:hypothetical protein
MVVSVKLWREVKMSADNYIYIDPVGDKFRVTMQFASVDDLSFKDSDPVFDTMIEAAKYATDWEVREVVVEYGISISPRCFDYYDDDNFSPDEGDVCSDHPTNGRSLTDGCDDCDPDDFENGEKLEYLIDCGV